MVESGKTTRMQRSSVSKIALLLVVACLMLGSTQATGGGTPKPKGIGNIMGRKYNADREQEAAAQSEEVEEDEQDGEDVEEVEEEEEVAEVEEEITETVEQR